MFISSKQKKVFGWGRSTYSNSSVYSCTAIKNVHEVVKIATERGYRISCRGAGRSYGDNTLNDNQVVLDLSRMSEISSWDPVTGIITAAAVDDYLNGNIKVHEKTITKREKMFKDYLQITGFNADPVLLSYSDNDNINFIVSNKMLERSEYEFTTTNKVNHKLWKIDDEKIINKRPEIKIQKELISPRIL